jgi:hypothetical protein
MQFPTFITLESVEVEVLPPSSTHGKATKRTRRVSAPALNRNSTRPDGTGFRTRESLSMALANALHLRLSTLVG